MSITNFQDAVCKCLYVDCVGFSDVFLYSEKYGAVVQISNVTLALKTSNFCLNVSIKNMVANIYVSYRTV